MLHRVLFVATPNILDRKVLFLPRVLFVDNPGILNKEVLLLPRLETRTQELGIVLQEETYFDKFHVGTIHPFKTNIKLHIEIPRLSLKALTLEYRTNGRGDIH